MPSGLHGVPVRGCASLMNLYVSVPDGPGPFPGVVIGMEIFGIDTSMKTIADRIAREGYVAVVPDFYHRTAPGAYLAYDTAGRSEGLRLAHLLTRDGVLRDMESTLDYLKEGPSKGKKTGFLGFSLGGHIGYLSAASFPLSAAVLFYGGWIMDTGIALSRPEPTSTLTSRIARQGGRVLYFVGAEDHLINREQVALLKETLSEAGVPHTVVVYPGVKHGFFAEGRPESFNAGASRDAWGQTRLFFDEHLRSAVGAESSVHK